MTRVVPTVLRMPTETPRPTDRVRRFIFENRPVRGHWVALEQAWRELRAHTRYPRPVEELLGEAVAASVLLAATLKFRGTLTFQLQGNGAVSFLVAQCTHDFRLRAVARCDEEAVLALSGRRSGAAFRELVGSEGRVTVTVESDERSARYQGIVPLAGGSLAASLETYFASSEQLPTRVRLAADETHAGGILVQKLPAPEGLGDEDPGLAAWEEAERGLSSVGPAELLAAPVEDVLGTHFPRHDLRLFRGAAVQFECRCSAGRVASVLRALGAGEIHDVLREQGSVTVTCEFCQRPYRFDSIDIEALFADQGRAGPPGAIH
jgi:molecular chaperone Hsp33